MANASAMVNELKVLLVEDLATDAELAVRELRRAGIACVARRVETEIELRQALDEFAPDIILSDFTLPRLNALAALAIVQAERPDIPFIYVSGTIGEERAIESLKRGATDYVLKTNLARLAPSVKRAMQEVAERAARRQAEEQLRLAANALENTAEAVMIIDIDKRIVSVNKAFATITGYNCEDVIRKTPAHLQADPDDAALYAAIWDILDGVEHWQGEIWNRRKSGEIYPALLTLSAVRNNAGTTTHYVGVFNDVSKLKQYETRLEFLAHYDALTHLPNRMLFLERFQEAINRANRWGSVVGLLFIDLDRFKTINDSLGHPVGDQLLQSVAERMTECVRKSDTVARLGGDEFAVLLDELHHSQEAVTVAQKLLDALAKPFTLAGYELFTSLSIGISCYPQDGDDVNTLLQNADTAMYRAKEQGRNAYRCFSAKMNVIALERLVMANNLRQALERREFLLHYQPIIDLSSRTITAVEALIRWQHPELGLIPPAKFIPLAEETGLINPIGEWVLETACAQAKTWQRSGFHPMRMAINLSADQFRQPYLIRQLDSILGKTSLDARWLELEITESMAMVDPEGTQKVLAELNTMGIRIAVDDFGTGYSSLGYLKRFPIDYLKIDQSFVRDIPEDQNGIAITKTIIAMAKTLKQRVIAEGVEKDEQLAFLTACECEEGQGYFFSRPRTALDLEKLMRETPTW